MDLRALSCIAIGLSSAACASTPGAEPHDMSAAAHIANEQDHAGRARAHTSRYDPEAAVSRSRCSQGAAARDTFDVCWTSSINPTKEHLDHAEEHRKHAADHRAASEVLRATEAQACAGLTPDERDISPFSHVEDIAAVERLTVPDLSGDLPADRTVGAAVTFRAVPGMTAEWLQLSIDCHLARNAALGHSRPDLPDCPLVPRGVSAEVESAGNGFTVSIRAADIATAKDVLARAGRLVKRSPQQ